MALSVSPFASARRIARGARLGLFGLSLVSTIAPAGAAEDPPAGVRPKTYALIAAIGDQFAMVTEHPSTGTHLSPIRRTNFAVEGDLLNRLALRGLDAAVAKLDPDSRRIYLTLKPEALKDLSGPQRASATLGRVVTALETMPQRSEWDRIVILTPTYAAKDREGLPGKLQGPGMFVQPMCQGRTGLKPGDPDSCTGNTRPPAGPEATAPADTVSRVNYYAAPYSYVQVWILDPRTLVVIDQQKVFDHQKLFDPNNGPLGLPTAEFMAARFTAVIQKSIGKAVDDTVLRGTVETGEVREVGPENVDR